jgi:hypothetical protein
MKKLALFLTDVKKNKSDSNLITLRSLYTGVHFIKHDIQGVFLKCAEILPTRLFDNVEN